MYIFFFFFQAEDGIRDADVTGVQTCALPISVWDWNTSPIRYLVRSMLLLLTDSIGRRLVGRTEPNRSNTEPCFRKRVVKPANGPNSSAGSPLMIRVSRCGTDMGGAPIGALP